MKRQHQKTGSNTIRNVPAFVKSYLTSDSGKAALSRKPIRAKAADGTFQNVWRSSAMAHAFQQLVS